MASLAAGNEVGDTVTVLWCEGHETRVGYGLIVSEAPFAVELEGDAWPETGTEARLVRDQGDRWVAGSANVDDMDEGLLVMRRVLWEEPSQRIHDRTEVEWPTTLRVLDDRGTRETYEIGLMSDVSLGGAGVQMSETPEVGSLVELRACPPGAIPLRAVGVVVRRTGFSIGVAFLYLWGAGLVRTESVELQRRAA